MEWLTNLWNDLTGITASRESLAAQETATTTAQEQLTSALSPYQEAGLQALEQQQKLSGAMGPEAQQAALSSIQASPLFQQSLKQAETSLLQNASATGGLRGGNVQGALSQLSPQLLNQAVNTQLGQLSGLSGMGLGAASTLGTQGANMLSQLGQAQAGQALGEYQLQRQAAGDLFGGLTNLAGLFLW